MMLVRLTLAFLVARSSALALQPVLARSAAAVRSAAALRSAPSMQVDWDARQEAKEQAAADAHAKLLAHLRAPIRQYEGGWGDTALRNGGKDTDRFGKGPTPHLITEDDAPRGSKDDGPKLPADKQAQLVLPEESFKVTKMEMSQTDEDYVMECDLGEGETEAEMFIDIEPMFLTKEEYFYGFTADSDPKISIDHSMSDAIEGEMNAKDHAARREGTATSLDRAENNRRLMIKLKFQPEFAAGEFVAHLCFILPNEKAFSKFYKITGKSIEAGTRDS
mmetsp:Transcript_54294/g.140193  ORF Transcript_54294/g.140193 Transcript_54294/m.140193 type:complete len:277 (-) Transcript_54294:272-1102(-)